MGRNGTKAKTKAGTLGSRSAAPVEPSEFPPPEYLLEKAHSVVNRKLIEDYSQAIQVLRDEKRLTYREIAEWLTKNGVPADHNSVYRAYTKHMDPAELAEVQAADDEEARDEQEEEQARKENR
jgi:hypothetical protein